MQSVKTTNMERLATGFAPARATKPGFVVENEKFRVTFEGVSSSTIKELTQELFQGDLQ